MAGPQYSSIMGSCVGGTQGGAQFSGNFISPLGGAFNQSTTESQWQFKTAFAGTWSNLSIQMNAHALTITSRKNTAAGAQTVTGSGSAGFFSDATHTDTLAVNDLIDLDISSAQLSGAINSACSVFTATGGSLVNLVVFQIGPADAIAASTFFPFFGGALPADTTTTEANAQSRVRAPGTLSYFQANIPGSTTFASAHTWTFRNNGANGNSTLSITASTTGIFVDTTHTDTIASGDLVCVSFGAASDANKPEWNCGGCIQQSGFSYDVFGYLGNDTHPSVRAASATTHFWGILNNQGDFAALVGYITTEAQAQIKFNYPGGYLTNARAFVFSNTYTAGVTWQLRKNTANANNALSIGASATGWFEDTTHSDSFLAADLWDYSISGGTSGNLGISAYLTTVNNQGVIEFKEMNGMRDDYLVRAMNRVVMVPYKG